MLSRHALSYPLRSFVASLDSDPLHKSLLEALSRLEVSYGGVALEQNQTWDLVTLPQVKRKLPASGFLL